MRFIFFIIIVFGFSLSTFGDEAVQTSSAKLNSGTAAKGVRLGIFKPNYTRKTEVVGGNLGGRQEESLADDDYGVTLGYVDYGIRRFGFDILANWAKTFRSSGLIRLEANGAYSFTQQLYVKAGLNTSADTGSGQTSDPNIGGQLGVGYQMTPRFGATLQYVIMRLSDESVFFDGADLEITYSGLELGVSATF